MIFFRRARCFILGHRFIYHPAHRSAVKSEMMDLERKRVKIAAKRTFLCDRCGISRVFQDTFDLGTPDVLIETVLKIMAGANLKKPYREN